MQATERRTLVIILSLLNKGILVLVLENIDEDMLF